MTDEHLIELYEERAAIMEHDGGLTRKQAERAAYFDIRKCVGKNVVMPEEIREEVRLTQKEKIDGT